jgi:hypothetical protein
VRDGVPGGTTTGGVALHIGLGAPPLVPPHVHVHGPVVPPVTVDTGPDVAQRLDPDGAVAVVVPLALPQTPATEGGTTTTGV